MRNKSESDKIHSRVRLVLNIIAPQTASLMPSNVKT